MSNEWKLVPVNPTPEMLKAADLEHASRKLVSIALISYRAMLAAAPQQPAPQPLTDEQFAQEWHKRTGRIMGTDKALLLQAKFVTERAHGIKEQP